MRNLLWIEQVFLAITAVLVLVGIGMLVLMIGMRRDTQITEASTYRHCQQLGLATVWAKPLTCATVAP